MNVVSAPEDWDTLAPALREQLARYLPLQANSLPLSLGALALAERHTIRAHLEQLCTSISAMVPRWVAKASAADAAYLRTAASTLLFADVTGFTPLTAQLEAFGRIGNEYLTHALNRFFAAVVPVALAHGGDLLAFGGDALLVAFSGADHAGSAAVAAWDMQQAMAALDLRELNLPNLVRLQMKIGLASGPLVLASVGSPTRRIALPLGSVLDTTDAMATMPGRVRLDARAAAGAAMAAQLDPQPDGSALLARLHDRRSPRARAAAAPATLGDLVARIAACARYLPRGVVDSLIAAPHAAPGHGEQRHVVNLFSHLAGLHELADQLGDPAAAVAVAELAFGRALAIIEGHGGVLARVDIYPHGHKLLALFGAPVAHEHEVMRAIGAALALRDAMPQLNAEIATLLGAGGNGAALRLRSGINAGPVVAGLVGSPLRWEYTVMGDAVNVGARLMSNAQPGEVLAGAHVSAVAKALLDGETRTLLLKGKREPVAAFAVRALRDADRSPLFRDAPVVGREAEQATLGSACEALRLGEGAVVFIQGEAGIGKSQLARELPSLLGPGVNCIQTSPPGLVRVSFGLFRALLTQICRTTRADFLERNDLRAVVDELCPQRGAEFYPALAALLGTSDADLASFGTTAEEQQRILAWALQGLLVGAAAHRPLAWICEDLHAADDASLAVLKELLTLGWNAPVLLCATIRTRAATPRFAQQLMAAAAHQLHHNAILLELGGLPSSAGNTLLASLLPGLAPSSAQALHEHTLGNPLFLQVLAQTVQQRRMLAPSSQGLTLRGSLAALRVPQTLRELLAAQVDQLPAEVRRLAQVAAVIAMADRTIPLWLLQQMVDDGHAVEPRLRALEQAQVIEAATAPAACYLFRHALYQQAAYDQLLERERQDLHCRAGLALHSQQDQREVQVEALAYHCYEGRCWELAVGYCLAAGQRALRAYANRDARRLLRQALGLARRLAQQPHEEQARESLGELYSLLGRYPIARAQLERALGHRSGATSATPLEIEAQLRRHRLLAVVGDRTSEYHWAEGVCRAGLRLAARHLPASVETARLYAQLAVVMIRRGTYTDAEQVCHEGLGMLPAEPLAPRERVELLQLLGFIIGQRGDYPQAVQTLEQILPLAREMGDPYVLTPMLRDLGMFSLLMGKHERARAFYQESLSIDERIGDVFGRLRTLDNLGVLSMTRGDYTAALQSFTACLKTATALQLPEIRANLTINIGQAHYFQGSLDLAFDHLRQAHTLLHEIGDLRRLADCLYRLGDVALAQHDYEVALNYGVQSLAYARRTDSSGYVASALRVIGEAYLAQECIAQAASYLGQAHEIQARVDDPYDQALLLIAQARLAKATNDWDEANRLAQAAQSLAQEQNARHLILLAAEVAQPVAACAV